MFTKHATCVWGVAVALSGYPAAKADIPELAHAKHLFVKTAARVNNRAGNSHQCTRRRERKMCDFWRPRWNGHALPPGSWRMDETYVKVRGKWQYLYRAVDKAANTVDFLFRAHRDKTAASRYFEKTIDRNGVSETVSKDKSGANWPRSSSSTLSGSAHQGPAGQVSEQHCRAGSSGHHQADDKVQGVSVRPCHSVRQQK